MNGIVSVKASGLNELDRVACRPSACQRIFPKMPVYWRNTAGGRRCIMKETTAFSGGRRQMQDPGGHLLPPAGGRYITGTTAGFPASRSGM